MLFIATIHTIKVCSIYLTLQSVNHTFIHMISTPTEPYNTPLVWYAHFVFTVHLTISFMNFFAIYTYTLQLHGLEHMTILKIKLLFIAFVVQACLLKIDLNITVINIYVHQQLNIYSYRVLLKHLVGLSLLCF